MYMVYVTSLPFYQSRSHGVEKNQTRLTARFHRFPTVHDPIPRVDSPGGIFPKQLHPQKHMNDGISLVRFFPFTQIHTSPMFLYIYMYIYIYTCMYCMYTWVNSWTPNDQISTPQNHETIHNWWFAQWFVAVALLWINHTYYIYTYTCWVHPPPRNSHHQDYYILIF